MANMDVILLERVDKLGQMGEVVKVRPGFARNFLLPQGKALRATKENVALFEKQKAQLEARNLERRQEAEKVAGTMNNLTLTMIRQAAEGGQLYGSVTVRDIAEAMGEVGFTVERRQIELNQTIKELGSHQVRVFLHPEVIVPVTLNVARSQEEAAALAADEAEDLLEETDEDAEIDAFEEEPEGLNDER